MIVYIITNTVTGKRYIGKTVMSLDKRWSRHKARAKSGSKTYLHNSIRKHGSQAFTCNIIQECNTKDELNNLERYYITTYRTRVNEGGFNMTGGGDGGLGLLHSEEAKKKIGNAAKGRVFSEEHRKKISEALKVAMKGKQNRKGIPCSESTKRKIGVANRNPPSEVRARLNAGQRLRWARIKQASNVPM